MDILEFYQQLSTIIGNYDYVGRVKSKSDLKKLIKDAKDSGLEVDVSEDIISDIESFYEETSYDGDDDSSYGDDDSSYDGDDVGDE